MTRPRTNRRFSLRTVALLALLVAPCLCGGDDAPVWIGDCCYYPDGSYYHRDGVYWLADLKTHYVYAEGCWHLANGGILTDTGVYFPRIAAPDGLLGLPWRLAAVMTSLAGGPPQNPGKPPAEPVREVTEARSSSGR